MDATYSLEFRLLNSDTVLMKLVGLDTTVEQLGISSLGFG